MRRRATLAGSLFLFTALILTALAIAPHLLVQAQDSDSSEEKATPRAASTSKEATNPERTSYLLTYGESPPPMPQDHITTSGFEVMLDLHVAGEGHEGLRDCIGSHDLPYPTQLMLELDEADHLGQVKATYQSSLEVVKPGVVRAVFPEVRPMWSREHVAEVARRAKWSLYIPKKDKPQPIDVTFSAGQIEWVKTIGDSYGSYDVEVLKLHAAKCQLPLTAWLDRFETLVTAKVKIADDLFGSMPDEVRLAALRNVSIGRLPLKVRGQEVDAVVDVRDQESLRAILTSTVGDHIGVSEDDTLTLGDESYRNQCSMKVTKKAERWYQADLQEIPLSTFVPRKRAYLVFDQLSLPEVITTDAAKRFFRERIRKGWKFTSAGLEPPQTYSDNEGDFEDFPIIEISREELIPVLQAPGTIQLVGNDLQVPHSGISEGGVVRLESFEIPLASLLDEEDGELLVQGRFIAPGGTWPINEFQSNDDRSIWKEGEWLPYFTLPANIRSEYFLVQNNPDGEWEERRFTSNRVQVAADGSFCQIVELDIEQSSASELPELISARYRSFTSVGEALENIGELMWALSFRDSDVESVWSSAARWGEVNQVDLKVTGSHSRVLQLEEVKLPGGLVTISPKLIRPKIFEDGSIPKPIYDALLLDAEPTADDANTLGVDIHSHPSTYRIPAFPNNRYSNRPWSLFLPAGTYECHGYTEDSDWERRDGALFGINVGYGNAWPDVCSSYLRFESTSDQHVQAELPLYRIFKRIHVRTPEGEAKQARLMVFSIFSGFWGCNSPTDNFDYRSDTRVFFADLRDLMSERYDCDHYEPFPNLGSAQELRRKPWDTSTLNTRFYGDSPLYISSETGAQPLYAMAWTEDYAPEWIRIPVEQEVATIELKKLRIAKEGFRPEDKGGTYYFPHRITEPSSLDGPELYLVLPDLGQREPAFEASFIWISHSRPDGVVEKFRHVVGPIQTPYESTIRVTVDHGVNAFWFEADPFDDGERVSEEVSLEVIKKKEYFVSDYEENRRPPLKLQLPALDVDDMEFAYVLDEPLELLFDLEDVKDLPEGLMSIPSLSCKLQASNGKVMIVDRKRGGFPGFINHGVRFDWTGPVLFVGSDIEVESSDDEVELWASLEPNAVLLVVADASEAAPATIHVDAQDHFFGYEFSVSQRGEVPIWLPRGESTIRVEHKSGDYRVSARRDWGPEPRRIEPILYDEWREPGTYKVDFKPSVNVEQGFVDLDTRKYFEDYRAVSVHGSHGIEIYGYGEHDLPPGRYHLYIDETPCASYRNSDNDALYSLFSFYVQPNDDNVVQLPHIEYGAALLTIEEQCFEKVRTQCEAAGLDAKLLLASPSDERENNRPGVRDKHSIWKEWFTGSDFPLKQTQLVQSNERGEHRIYLMVGGFPVASASIELEVDALQAKEVRFDKFELFDTRIAFDEEKYALLRDFNDLDLSVVCDLQGVPRYRREVNWKRAQADGKVVLSEYFPQGDYQIVQTLCLETSDRIEVSESASFSSPCEELPVEGELHLPVDGNPQQDVPTVRIPLPEFSDNKSFALHARILRYGDDLETRPNYLRDFPWGSSWVRGGECIFKIPEEFDPEVDRVFITVENIGPIEIEDASKHAWISNVFALNLQKGEFLPVDLKWSRPAQCPLDIEFSRYLSRHGWKSTTGGFTANLQLPDRTVLTFEYLWNMYRDYAANRYYGGSGMGPLLPRGRSILTILNQKAEVVFEHAIDIPAKAAFYELPEDVRKALIAFGVASARD